MSIFRPSFTQSTSYHILCSSLSTFGSTLTSSLWALKSEDVLLQSAVKHLEMSHVCAYFQTAQLSGIAQSLSWLGYGLRDAGFGSRPGKRQEAPVIIQSCVAKRQGYVLRNSSLGDFVVVRTSYSVLTQTQTVQYSLLHTYAIWYSLLLLGYKPVQHVTVLNTVGSCKTMVSIIILWTTVVYTVRRWSKRRYAARDCIRFWRLFAETKGLCWVCPFPAAVEEARCSEWNLPLSSDGWLSLWGQFLYFPPAKLSKRQYPDHKVNLTYCAVHIRTISPPNKR
jgi:hypothetical protein